MQEDKTFERKKPRNTQNTSFVPGRSLRQCREQQLKRFHFLHANQARDLLS